MKIRRKIFIVLCFVSISVFSVGDSLKHRFGIYGGAIYSQAYPKNLYEDYSSKIHSLYYSDVDKASAYLPGYFFGISYGRKSGGSFFTVLADVSRYSLEYEVHESINGPYPRFSSKTIVAVDSYELNYQLQWEKRIFRNLYLANGILLHQAVHKKWHREEESTVTSFDNNVYYTTRSIQVTDYTTGFEIITGISYRLGLSYNLLKNKCSISAFRNFGYPARPWWGLGVSIFPIRV